MRRGLIFALAVFLNLGSFAVLAVSLLAREEHLYGVVNPVFAESLPFRTPLFGVNAELTSYRSDEELERQLRLMQDAGVTWVRQFVYWDHVELVRGQFDWDGYDRIVDAVSAHESLRLVAVLMNTPEWARDAGSPNDPTSPPPIRAILADLPQSSRLATREWWISSKYGTSPISTRIGGDYRHVPRDIRRFSRPLITPCTPSTL